MEAVLRGVYGLLAHGVALRGRPGRADWPIGRLRATPGALPDLRTRAPLLPTAHGALHGEGADYPGAIWAPSPNYTPARQRANLRVGYVVIHDTEGSCAAALNWLDGPASGSSAHFLVCQDGTVYQLAHVRDIAWHAGNWYINQHSIGIEHEGFRDSGGYTQAQYDASAAIVRWLDHADGLHIQLDRNAIFGHENVPNGGHTDPGPWWDWAYYMSHVRNENEGAVDAWREAIEIGRRNNIPVEISHIKLGVKPVWGRAAEGLKILEDARRDGVRVMADWYPYTYWQSSMYVLIETRDFENRAAWEKGFDDIGGAQNVLITNYRHCADRTR